MSESYDDESSVGSRDIQAAEGNLEGAERHVVHNEAERAGDHQAQQTRNQKDVGEDEEEEEDDATEWQSPPPSQDFYYQPSQNTPIYVPCPHELREMGYRSRKYVPLVRLPYLFVKFNSIVTSESGYSMKSIQYSRRGVWLNFSTSRARDG
jgi:hypothetical protein